MSAENIADTPASRDPERTEEPIKGILHELVEERIKATLGPLNEQRSTLIQLLNQLIQENWARISSSTDFRTQQTQSRRSASHEAGTSRALPARKIASTGCPLDTIQSAVSLIFGDNFMSLSEASLDKKITSLKNLRPGTQKRQRYFVGTLKPVVVCLRCYFEE